MKSRTLFAFWAGATALAVSLSTSSMAQTAPTMYRSTITHVKPDMADEWLDLQKNEVLPALKKAGQTSRTVYVSGLFGNSYEYLTVTPFAKYADFDGQGPLVRALDAPGAARLNAKLNKCIVSQNSYELTRLLDISNVIDGPPPTLIASVRYRIAAGKMQEFHDLVKSDILPVYKKSKVTLIVSQRGPGANVNDVTMTTGYFKYADLDGGPFLVKQLGQEGANRVNAKFTGIRTLMEVLVRRRVAELSL